MTGSRVRTCVTTPILGTLHFSVNSPSRQRRELRRITGQRSSRGRQRGRTARARGIRRTTVSSAPVRIHLRIRLLRVNGGAPYLPTEPADWLHTTRFRRCDRGLIAAPCHPGSALCPQWYYSALFRSVPHRAGGASAPRSSSLTSDLRITRVFPCVARGFKPRPSFMFAGCCWWRSLAIDGCSGTSRGHGSVMRRPGSRWDGAVERPSAFQAGYIPSWRGSSERCALPTVAADSGWLLLLLSPLLSAADPSPHLRGLPGAVTAPWPAQTPPPNPIAAEPDGRRVLSRGGEADHAATPQAPLTGSGCREHSYGGFGGGHPHFHPHATPARNPRIKRQAYPCRESSKIVRSFGRAWVFAVRRDPVPSDGVAARVAASV